MKLCDNRILLPYSVGVFFFDLTFSMSFFIPRVIAMHSGKYGVNGPAQNARYAVAATDAHFIWNKRWSKYPPHTGVYISTTTITNNTMVRQSLHSLHTHLQKFINLFK